MSIGIARDQRASWGRIGASATLALMTHVGVVLALPNLAAPIAKPIEALSLGAINFDVDPPRPLDQGSSAMNDAARLHTTPAGARAELTSPHHRSAPQREIATTPQPRVQDADTTLAPPAEPAHIDATSEVVATGAAATHDVDANVDVGVGGVGPLQGVGAGDGAAPAGQAATGGSGARMLASGDPCAGYFPVTAQAKRARVSITVDIDAQGVVLASNVIDEQPVGQGFSQAARACVSRIRFAPATSPQGHKIRSSTTLRLLFQRIE